MINDLSHRSGPKNRSKHVTLDSRDRRDELISRVEARNVYAMEPDRWWVGGSEMPQINIFTWKREIVLWLSGHHSMRARLFAKEFYFQSARRDCLSFFVIKHPKSCEFIRLTALTHLTVAKVCRARLDKIRTRTFLFWGISLKRITLNILFPWLIRLTQSMHQRKKNCFSLNLRFAFIHESFKHHHDVEQIVSLIIILKIKNRSENDLWWHRGINLLSRDASNW